MRLMRFGIFFVFGIVAIWAFQVSVQPWILLAGFVNGRIFTVAFGWIPFLGGLITWLFGTGVGQQFLAACLFIMCQLIQCRYWMHQLGFYPVRDARNLKSLQILTAVAYAVELVISFVIYTPYRGGFEAFSRDIKLGRFDTDNIEVGQLFGFAASAVWTEALLWIALTINRTFTAPSGGGKSPKGGTAPGSARGGNQGQPQGFPAEDYHR